MGSPAGLQRVAVRVHGEFVEVPPRFWRDIEFGRRSKLNRREIARLWKILARTDTPPKSLSIYVWKDELDELPKGIAKGIAE